MEKKNVFVVKINGGVWEVFDSKEKVIGLFKEELEGDFVFEDEGSMSVEEGVEHLLFMGSCGEVAICENEELCEMGDDYCELSVVESEIK